MPLNSLQVCPYTFTTTTINAPTTNFIITTTNPTNPTNPTTTTTTTTNPTNPTNPTTNTNISGNFH